MVSSTRYIHIPEFKVAPSCYIIKELVNIGRLEVYTHPLINNINIYMIPKEVVVDKENLLTNYCKISRARYKVFTLYTHKLIPICNTLANYISKYTSYPYHPVVYSVVKRLDKVMKEAINKGVDMTEPNTINKLLEDNITIDSLKDTLDYIGPLLGDPDFTYTESVEMPTIFNYKINRSIGEHGYGTEVFKHININDYEDYFLVCEVVTVNTKNFLPNVIAFRMYREKYMPYILYNNSVYLKEVIVNSNLYIKVYRDVFDKLDIIPYSEDLEYTVYNSLGGQFINEYISTLICKNRVKSYKLEEVWGVAISKIMNDDLEVLYNLEKISMKLTQDRGELVEITPHINIPRGYISLPKNSLFIIKKEIVDYNSKENKIMYILPEDITKREFKKSIKNEYYYATFIHKGRISKKDKIFRSKVLYSLYYFISLIYLSSMYSYDDSVRPILYSQIINRIVDYYINTGTKRKFKKSEHRIHLNYNYNELEDTIQILAEEMSIEYSKVKGKEPMRYYIYVIDPFSKLTRNLFTGRLDKVSELVMNKNKRSKLYDMVVYYIKEYSIPTRVKDIKEIIREIVLFNGFSVNNKGKVEFYELPYTEAVVLITPNRIEEWIEDKVTPTVKELIRMSVDTVLEL